MTTIGQANAETGTCLQLTVNGLNGGTESVYVKVSSGCNSGTMAAVKAPSSTPLSIAELDKLCTHLADKYLFEEAYACAAHMTVLSGIETLNTVEKEKGIETDELSIVLTNKSALTNLSSQLATLAQEYEWIRAAALWSVAARACASDTCTQCIGVE